MRLEEYQRLMCRETRRSSDECNPFRRMGMPTCSLEQQDLRHRDVVDISDMICIL